ncbi:tetratricopeptide repeat protein [Promethearchaeum syntrophicum]|uniref:Tetratricopeptide repeat protein n=1 Tax=Promethearchaeum syntrophicum TaxID=2594042 RepID=A0A5B9DDB0_9ARCH|nr:tetratricopeptide repeat protein [Candidatus Prometheoarchaeum syntrophicum]QEE17021.1 Tetratricopeptide repeat protein [Candidatus Prometheoarchaeum syntrophicum]
MSNLNTYRKNMSQGDFGEPRKEFEKGRNFLVKAERAIYRENYKKAMNFLSTAQDIFKKSNSILMIAKVHFLEGYIHENLHEWEKTLEFYKLSLELRKIAGTSLIIAETEKKIAETLLKLNNYQEAHKYAQTAIDILENENQPFAKADSLYTNGTIYFAEKDWKSAIFYYNLALDYLKNQYHWKLFLKIHENLGKAYKKLGNYIESNHTFKKALKLEHEKKNYTVIISILKEMAENYKFLNNKKKSVEYITDAIDMERKFQKINSDKNNHSSQLQLAEILFYFNDFQQAMEICEESIEFAETYNNQIDLVQGLTLTTKILLNKNLLDDQNLDLIQNYLVEARDIAESLKDTKNIIEILILKIRLYKKINKSDEILEILRIAEELALNSSSKCSLGDVYEQYGLLYHSLDFEKALSYFKLGLEEYIECDSIQDQAEMHYNIACMSSLMDFPEEIIDHLTIAVELNSKFKIIAKEDEDFKSIRKLDLFRSIIE